MKAILRRIILAASLVAPAGAIYLSFVIIGGLGPMYAWYFRKLLNGRPLPVATEWILPWTSEPRIPLNWVGLGVALLFLALGCSIARRADSPERVLKRLYLFASAGWVGAFLLMTAAAFIFPLPFLPISTWGERIDMAILPRFIEEIKSTGAPVVYEGLPHQDQEAALFKSEKRSKPTKELHGYYFYRKPVAPSPEDDAVLQGLLLTTPPFTELRGECGCSSYHPDFALEWTDAGGRNYDALICFGCGEAKLYGPGIRLYCDVSGLSYKALKEILSKYHENRPNYLPKAEIY